MVEKILARASGRASVAPGDVVVADVDTAIFHDLSGYITSRVFEREVDLPVARPDRVVLVFDHTFSPPTEEQAEALHHVRDFARRHGLQLFDCGSGNIHNVVARHGFSPPGGVVVGSDSHTPVHGVTGAFAAAIGNDCHAGMVLPHMKSWFRVPETVRVELVGQPAPGTSARDVALWLVSVIGEGGLHYAAVEFGGEYVEALDPWDRWLLTLLAVDLDAKCTFIDPALTARSDLSDFRMQADDVVTNDPGESYAQVLTWDVSGLPPQIACPPTVGNVRPVSELVGTPVHWCELGGHGGGRLRDIERASTTLTRSGLDPTVLFNVVPSSRADFEAALDAGVVSDLQRLGANWYPASTGSNQAVNMGALAAGETMISTHARNFPGRNGSARSQMFLASAATVAASAANGRITDPREMLEEDGR